MRFGPSAASSRRRRFRHARVHRVFARATAAALVLSIVLASVPARAQDAYSCVPRLSDVEVRLRLAFVEHALERSRRVEIPWWSGWMAFNVANAALAWVRFAQVSEPVKHVTWLWNAIGSTTFIIPESIVPMPGLYARHRLRRLPESTPEERRAKLIAATRLLERDAYVTATNRNWGAHVGGWGYATASTGYIAFRSRNTKNPQTLWIAATLQFTTTAFTAEATILSVPRRGERAFARYRGFACSDPRIGTPDVSEPPTEDEEAEDESSETSRPSPPAPRVQVGASIGGVFLFGTF